MGTVQLSAAWKDGPRERQLGLLGWSPLRAAPQGGRCAVSLPAIGPWQSSAWPQQSDASRRDPDSLPLLFLRA